MTPPPNLPRVFVDTSVLFAAALSPTGSARDLVLAAARQRVGLVVSTLVLVEAERNLRAKAPHALPDFNLLRRAAIFSVTDPSAAQVARAASVIDPKDAPIVAAANAAGTTLLATYDRRHLLSQAAIIAQHCGITVETPDNVMRALGI